MSDSITFKYTLTEGDHARAWRIHNNGSRVYMIVWFLLGLFVTAIVTNRLILIADGERDWSSLFSALVPAGIYLGLVWFSLSWRPRFLARQSPYRGLENDVTVTEMGVTSSNTLLRYEVQWGAYTHAIEKPDMFLLYTGRLLFYPIPISCFENPQDVDRFRDLVRTNIPKTRLLD